MAAIITPYGVSVLGSATLRVPPDVAVISFSCSVLRPQAKDAYAVIRESAQNVQAFLAEAKITDAGASRVMLSEEFDYQAPRKFLGYRTRVTFRVILSDLQRVEEIITGAIEHGINNIQDVSFQTTRLKDLRAEARRRAIDAARQKAALYCDAAGVQLGDVIHIEDINPVSYEQSRAVGHGGVEGPIQDENSPNAFDPGHIIVAGAVQVAYKIQGQ